MVVTTPTMMANVSGAIFTSRGDGSGVNGNNYALKADVYLNGGPPPNAPCTSAGLPDGTYYFQVTDPSGGQLLSTDSVNDRRFTISGGLITSVSPGTHAVGGGKCAGAVSVQLIPFATTPNRGCVYKVWASQNPSFPENESKTDNFRTCDDPTPPSHPDAVLSGVKWYDLNRNGSFDLGEVPIPGFRIQISTCDSAFTSCTPVTTATTDSTGFWSTTITPGSYFKVCEVAPSTGTSATWVQTGPLAGATAGPATANSSKCWTGLASADVPGLDFFNYCNTNALTLGFWSNKNGQAILNANDSKWRNLLNDESATSSTYITPTHPFLRDAAAVFYKVPSGAFSTSYTNFRTWLLNATATNMAYMLSAQLATMELNVNYGGTPANTLLLTGPGPNASCDITNSLGYVSISNLMSDAIRELRANGSTLSGSADRSCQEFKKTALDDANNQRSVAICPVYYGE